MLILIEARLVVDKISIINIGIILIECLKL